MDSVQEVARQVTLGCDTEREKAIALHNYVRDHVKFGFTKYFDKATPEYTLSCGIGHCNPQSQLMVALFRAIGLESYEHFTAIPNDILKDVFPLSTAWMLSLCPQLGHAYVDVRVDDVWYAIDSQVVDTPLLKAAQARLEKENRSLGYGTRVGATNVWDGQSDAFSQFDPAMMIEDHGRIDDLEAYFGMRKYRNQVLGLRFNTVFRLTGAYVPPIINSYIDGLRAEYIE
jgi:hypothetical protein